MREPEITPEDEEMLSEFSQEDQHFLKRLQLPVDYLCTRISERRQALRSHCQSPIERRMADMLVTCPYCNTIMRGPTIWKPGQGHPREDHGLHGGTYLCPQFQIGPHRVDFALLLIFTQGEVRIVIECDGHDFHEKTKEQAASDKARDRYLTEQGYRVVRFTGSEIWNDPIACGNQVTEILLNECQRRSYVRFDTEHGV